jgi:ABC transporter substrate binding protein
MKRRKFVMLLGGAAAWPLAARAQQPAMPVIGWLGGGTAASQRAWVDAFVRRLGELGWIEGRTVAIEYRWGEGRAEGYAEIAAEFVRLKPDVIVGAGTEAAIAAKQATSSIPIVFRRRETRSAAAWLPHWHDPAATLPAYRIWEQILLLDASKSCARFSRA